ncbi:unnamed protein product [marine sediment metagenome]|uniref:Exonuclease domain-containing protein n=1 Tax=marine sediment metagenome TaxID=412755 RepID=X0SM71_9ZZZZ
MKNILIFDTETTGFKDPRMIQFAYKTDKLSFESMYNPGRPIEEGAVKCHGITDEMVKDKEDFHKTSDKKIIQMLVDENISVAHNAKFDLKILAIEGIMIPRSICTYQCCLNILNRPNKKGHNQLQNLKEEFNLEIPEGTKAHDAMGDVIVLEQLFYYILSQMKGTDEEKIKRMINAS